MSSGGWRTFLARKSVGAALAWAITSALLFYRLPYGTSYGDESYYNAMPYAFAIGNKPYVDELGVFQNAGILLMPFYKAYLAINGSGDGLVLFNRYLYFICVLGCSVAAMLLVRRIASMSAAFCVAALVTSFSYFNIFALSYNTCGAFGFFCGTVFAARALLEPRPGWALFGASLFLLLAMFGYPGLAPVVALYMLIVVLFMYRETPRETFVNGLFGLGAGAILALLAALTLAIRVGQSDIARLLEFSRGMGYGTQGVLQRLNVFGMIVHAWHWIVFAYVALFVALPFACLFLKRTVWLCAVAVGAAFAFAFCYAQGLKIFLPSAGAICMTASPVLAPLCIALNRTWKYARFVLVLIWLPSFISMVTLTYTSSNQFYAAYLGALGVTLAGVVSFAAYLDTLSERSPELRVPYRVVFASFFLSLLAIQVRALYAGAYGEESQIAKLDTRVRSGPMRGAKTSRKLAVFLESIDRDLRTVERTQPWAKSVTIFDDFSAGYMSTRLKPRTFSNWILWGFFPGEYARQIARETFGDPERLADILVEVHTNPTGRSYWTRYVRGRYRPLIRRPELDYVILKKIGRHAAAKRAGA